VETKSSVKLLYTIFPEYYKFVWYRSHQTIILCQGYIHKHGFKTIIYIQSRIDFIFGTTM